MLVRCPECGNEISSEARQCPHCGYPISDDTDARPGREETGCLEGVGNCGCMVVYIILAIIGLIFLIS